MTAIRKIKTFVANREIGNLLVPQANGQPYPIMEGRVNDFIMVEQSSAAEGNETQASVT